MARQDTVYFILKVLLSEILFRERNFLSGIVKAPPGGASHTKGSGPSGDSIHSLYGRGVSMGFFSTFFFPIEGEQITPEHME